MSLYHDQLARERELADAVFRFIGWAAGLGLLVWLFGGCR